MADDVDVKVKFEEAHFTSLPSQTNIYGLTSVSDETETSKVLVSSLKGRIFLVEYGNGWDNPVSRELPFTYIPAGDAEIVSIDSFVQPGSKGNRLVVGISFILFNVHSSPGNQKQFLNIYSCVEEGNEYCLDSIAEGCQHIELDFIPFQLYHTLIRTRGTAENVFLLSGSDHKVHMYREVMKKDHQSFEEQEIETFFPELHNLPSSAMWIDIQEKSNTHRLTAVGCQDGFVQLSVVNIEEQPGSIINQWNVQHDGPISSVRLFTIPTTTTTTTTNTGNEVSTKPSIDHIMRCKRDCFKKLTDASSTESYEETYYLLVCCTIEPCALYVDVLHQGFDRLVALPESDKFDCVLCTCIADVDWDGNNEILLGTYGQELLVYKLTNPPKNDPSLDMTITWQRSFSSPLFAIDYLDMTGDGVCEIVVACLSGLHILQHQLDDVANVCTSRM